MSNSNLNALLDHSIADLADLKEFPIFPAGAYNLILNVEPAERNERPQIVFKLKLLEVLELSDPNSAEPTVGTAIEIPFNLDNEFGQGQLKKLSNKFAAHQGLLPTSSLGEVFDRIQGGTFTFILTTRADKNDKEKLYQGIKDVILG